MSVAIARNGIGSWSKSSTSQVDDEQPAQQQQKLLALHDADRRDDATVLPADLEVEQIAIVGLLAPHRHLDARRIVGEEIVPVELADDLAHLVRRVAGRVHAADDRAHAGAGDAADRNVLALEHFDDADVRRAARAAAAEHEADARRGGGASAWPQAAGERQERSSGPAILRASRNRSPEMTAPALPAWSGLPVGVSRERMMTGTEEAVRPAT